MTLSRCVWRCFGLAAAHGRPGYNQICSGILLCLPRQQKQPRSWRISHGEGYIISSTLSTSSGELLPLSDWCTADSRRIGVEEGWKALYKGLGPSLVGIIPARSVFYLSKGRADRQSYQFLLLPHGEGVPCRQVPKCASGESRANGRGQSSGSPRCCCRSW